MVGAVYHQIGKPTNTVSYASIFSTRFAMAGREDGSFISIVLRLFLSIQFRSARLYGISGLISYKSAPAAFANASATFAVTPLAEKNATNLLLIHPSSLRLN